MFGSGRRQRIVEPVRPRVATHDGLACALWLRPGADDAPPAAGVVVIHGAGSVKEGHFDFARAGIALGFGVMTFDQRGHGDSEGRFDDRALADVVAMTDRLRTVLAPGAPVALRGSSLGGYLALRAAPAARAAAVVAISPAAPDGLRRALDDAELPWRTDRDAVLRLLAEQPLAEAVAALEVPVLFMHARGDEQVPVELSRELATHAVASGSRLIEVPGGHHRSVQHDEELQAVSLRFLEKTLGLR